ncbi:hypothetical protein RHSIM_Rhsim04G0189700 [Rhododendron simsii]|uniref:Transketolase N-terminal domain-containing protein n=1 Tax=Rhododendron simsii TaxID=118357 RepID=A0A834LQT1_RHOSS|nr:hypothetical protein RHSIM_Rhsim04G0189700 [Rhododendron simsii]
MHFTAQMLLKLSLSETGLFLFAYGIISKSNFMVANVISKVEWGQYCNTVEDGWMLVARFSIPYRQWLILTVFVTITIGYGSPKKGNLYSVHGSALDAKEVDATRKNIGWPFEPFYVPKDVNKHWSRHVPDGAALETEWSAKFADYEKKYKEEAAELKSISSGELPAGWEKALPMLMLKQSQIHHLDCNSQVLSSFGSRTFQRTQLIPPETSLHNASMPLQRFSLNSKYDVTREQKMQELDGHCIFQKLIIPDHPNMIEEIKNRSSFLLVVRICFFILQLTSRIQSMLALCKF